MNIQTVSDAIGVAKALYRGRDQYLFAKWDWWCIQLRPEREFECLIRRRWASPTAPPDMWRTTRCFWSSDTPAAL
jgi:hypothetical protein